MSRFIVYVQEVHTVPLVIEASSMDEARAKATDMIVEDDLPEPEYSHTIDSSEWPIMRA